MHSTLISTALESFQTYLRNNLSACVDHPAARVSDFWSHHFADRLNFPETRDFLAFRRGTYVYGIGDTGPSTPEQKRREFSDTSKSILLFTPHSFIEQLREPILGAPIVYPFGNSTLSASYVLNAGTAWRITELLKQFGISDRPLHVAEIGAGWGACASQLHQVCQIASYTVIDLPENLCLSSTYLSQTVPGVRSAFVVCSNGHPSPPESGTLNFGLPPSIGNLPGPYDLIINTLSFQEMDKETVDEYFAWAARVLAPDGILVSFNAHDKAGVRRPSEYLHDGLRPLHMAPFRKVPAGFFNTIPYEMVFGLSKATDLQPAGEAWVTGIDALGEMIQLGLDSDLIPLSSDILSPNPSPYVVDFLSRIRAIFYADDEGLRQELLKNMLNEHDVPLVRYLAGSYWHALGNMGEAAICLERSLAGGVKDFAAIRAQLLLATLSRSGPAATMPATLQEAAGGLWKEISTVISSRDVSALQNHIARTFDCPVNTPVTPQLLLKKAWRRINQRSTSALVNK